MAYSLMKTFNFQKVPANNSKETDLGGSEQQTVQIKTEYRKTDCMVGISIPTVRINYFFSNCPWDPFSVFNFKTK